MRRFVDETSLGWILAYRQIRYQSPEFRRKVLEQHTNDSLKWTMQQSHTIDQIGLNAWLQTPEATGYTLKLGPQYELFTL